MRLISDPKQVRHSSGEKVFQGKGLLHCSPTQVKAGVALLLPPARSGEQLPRGQQLILTLLRLQRERPTITSFGR